MYRRYGGRRSTQDRKNFSDFGLDSAMARPSSFDGPSMPPWRTISSSREDASLTTCAGLQALSPPTMWAKDCTAQGRFCLTVECACATNLRRSTQPEADVGVLKETFHTAISGRGIKDHARRHHRRSFSRCGTRPDRGRHLRHSRTLRHVPHAARVRRSDGDGWRSGG